MAFNVQSLPEYVEQNKQGLISKVMFSAPSVKYLNLMTGIKHTDALHLMSAEAGLQERTCGFENNGSVTFSDRNITVGNYKVNMSLCEQDLIQKWMNEQVKTAAGAEVLPFEEKIAGEIVANVAKQVEKLIWQADTTAATPDLFDGFLRVLAVDAAAQEVVPTATSTYGKVEEVYKAIGAEWIDKAVIYVGVDTMRDLVLDMVHQSLYHYDATMDPANLEIVLPGTSTKVVAVSGLNGTNKVVAAEMDNMVYGVDGQNDMEEFDLFYSHDNQEFRVVIKFNEGVQIAFPDRTAWATI